MTCPPPNDNGQAPPTPPPKLLPQHLADLRKSELSDEQIEACGFASVTRPEIIAKYLGWRNSAKKLGPCLGIPFCDAAGKPTGYVRLKPDTPRTKGDRVIKYESPVGKANRVYLPPKTRAVLADPAVPLLIAEGEKKAAKADQDGFPCIGLVGVYGWCKKRKNKEAPWELNPDLEAVAWQGRTVYIVYDSDLADKPEVQWAEWHLAESLAAKGAAVKVVRFAAMPNGAKCGLDDFLVAHGPDAFRKLLETAGPAKRPEDTRPEVVLGPLEFLCVEETITALAKNDKTLYQRAGLLTRVNCPQRPAMRQRLASSGGLKIEAVPTADLRGRITRHARVMEMKKVEGKLEKFPAHPPQWLVTQVESAGRFPGIRPLEAVITSPVLLPDGTVLQRPGYHSESGLLYQLEPDADHCPIPEQPTKADAEKTRDELMEVVCDFPFQTAAHKGAYLAAVLTPLARFAFHGPAPLFLIDANARGSGKGLLADTIAGIVFGREFARAAYTNDDDEMRKVIMAIALEAEQAVLLDNLAGAVGNPSLDAALTATEWQGRVLGKSQQPRLPLLAVWYATGNNVTLVGDTARRVCHIRIESPDEKPEERADFKHPDLLAWVRAERPRLLAAALTILSAYCRAGRPDMKLKSWGSYEPWTAMIRNAVVWVGLEDPGNTRQGLSAHSDADAAALRGLLDGWREIDPAGEGKTAGQALEILKDKDNAERFGVLREVVADLFNLPQGKLPPSGKFGCTLRKYRGRNIGGYCLDNRPAHGGVQAWFVRAIRATAERPDAEKSGGDGGDGGDVNPNLTREEGPKKTNIAPGENIPTIPTIPTNGRVEANGFHPRNGVHPPAGAKLHYQDANGCPCDPDRAHRWCWSGADRWLDVAKHPIPPLGG